MLIPPIDVFECILDFFFSSTEFELQGDQLVCYGLLFLSI